MSSISIKFFFPLTSQIHVEKKNPKRKDKKTAQSFSPPVKKTRSPPPPGRRPPPSDPPLTRARSLAREQTSHSWRRALRQDVVRIFSPLPSAVSRLFGASGVNRFWPNCFGEELREGRRTVGQTAGARPLIGGKGHVTDRNGFSFVIMNGQDWVRGVGCDARRALRGGENTHKYTRARTHRYLYICI